MAQATLDQLKTASIEQLFTLQQLVNKLDEAVFSAPQDLFSGNSIGKHIRHILELFDAVLSSYKSGQLNYDNRDRSQLLESSPSAAQLKIAECIQKIAELEADKTLVLEGLCGSQPSDKITLLTSISRELFYNIEHAVHHMAMLQMVINACKIAEMPADFGYAYSTRKHQNKN